VFLVNSVYNSTIYSFDTKEQPSNQKRLDSKYSWPKTSHLKCISIVEAHLPVDGFLSNKFVLGKEYGNVHILRFPWFIRKGTF